DAGLQRLLHGLAHDDARRLALDLAGVLRRDRTLTVNRTAERIDHAADQLGANRHLEYSAGAADFVALLELEVVAEHDGADVVFFEVERERGNRLAGLARVNLEHLSRHRLLKAVDASNSVLHFEDGTDFFYI